MNHVMIDLETLSLQPDAHICSLAAVFFDPKTGALGQEIYINIDPEDTNGVIDSRTVAWWSQQHHKIQSEALDPVGAVVTLPGALRALNAFIDSVWNETLHDPVIWARGNMDQTWLESAMRRESIKPMWRYSWWRDQRTAVSMIDPGLLDWAKAEGAHNPLFDCKHQIHDLATALRVLRVFE